ncbi:Demethylsterigmatocystin 6-O-methyltransferase [Talaromyces islandicus]|uniref:Demethylsterigmatocystin 6-O-methyltransferase n=1 Tax=Talaromyces islandicus TaxID=28573 RepID=A0A0U1LKI8_TALIS|nr:Demethylsterigmatocystin 6-O-methyltransferase [Talaromyces islandicus]
MDSIVDQIRSLVSKANAEEQLKILNTLNELQIEFQDPMEHIFGIYCSIVQVASIKIAVDLGLFRKLAALGKGSSRTVVQLSQDTGADPELLARILRFLASVRYVQEVGIDTYTAGKFTYILAHNHTEAAVVHVTGLMNPVLNSTPDFLAETGYKNITDTAKTPFQKAFNTELKPFEWLPQHPKLFASMQVVMTSLQSSNWTEGFDVFDKKIKSLSATTTRPSEPPFFVDVGGGYGHQCVQLLKKYPCLHGRLILEDLPEAIEKAERVDGIKYLTQDFFEPQTVKAAKFYYMRRILHDWPDDDCVKIFKRLADALGVDSKILLDEVVLPDTGAYWQSTLADLTMMVSFAGAERTSRKWHEIADRAGLKISQVHVFDVRQGYAITILEKA